MSRLQRIKNVLLLVLALTALFMATQPFGVMTSNAQVVGACILLASAAILSVLAIRDQPRDEREQQIINLSDKLGFTVGVLATGIAVLVGSIRGEHNSALEVVLALMVIAKLAANFYFNRTK